MSAFHEVLLPLPFALGASGGPERRVDIVALGSGAEARNTPWAHGRRRYDIGGAVRTLDELHALIAFFEARRGKLHGFRFRDPFDSKSCAPSQTPAALDQRIGVGTGSRHVFPVDQELRRRRGSLCAPDPQARRRQRFCVAVNNVALGGGALSVDTTTGMVTLSPLRRPLGLAVKAGFPFDTAVRFDIDRLDLSLDGFRRRARACAAA